MPSGRVHGLTTVLITGGSVIAAKRGKTVEEIQG